MLLVLAFHKGSADLAFQQLRVTAFLDKQLSHHLVLHYPEGCDQGAIALEASKLFEQVTLNPYSDPNATNPAPWPQPQNWAWAEAARLCTSDRFPKETKWFWWEADVTPLVSGWADKLQELAIRSKRPFVGGYVHGLGGHINGVAVYPVDVSRHITTEPFVVRTRPFDMVLSERLDKSQVYDARCEFFHYPRLNGSQCRVESMEVVNRIRSKGAWFFHGSNDGSVPALLLDEPLPSVDTKKPLVLIDLDAVDNQVEPADVLYQQDQSRLVPKGWSFVPRGTCREEVPNVALQSTNQGFQSGIFPFALNKYECNFNPTITSANGQLHMAWRQWTRRDASQGIWQSRLLRTQVDEQNCSISKIIPINTHMDYKDEQHEDPRLHYFNGGFYLGYVQWRHHARRYIAHQSLALFTEGWQLHRTFHVSFGGNGKTPIEGTGNEKNWVWFTVGNKLHCIYSFSPHQIFSVSGPQVTGQWSSDPGSARWPWGEIRGGTPPIQLPAEFRLNPDEPELLSFHHSSLWWRGRQKRYHMGAYTFSANPPFRVLRATQAPILSGSEKNSRTLGGPLVVFPGGAAVTQDGKSALVVYGLNDEQCGWSKIHLEWLCSKMEPVI